MLCIISVIYLGMYIVLVFIFWEFLYRVVNIFLLMKNKCVIGFIDNIV